ncbi:uncharacterized protein [Nicotiana sylvestris]|uniref:uncharacterized protein n=1 Tax=Nicotiana sylvestris TaxID=4096 RepID=UPI00388CC1A9
MIIKLVAREYTLNIVSAYALHVGLDEEVKRRFLEELDKIVRQVPPAEKLFIGGDFNGHIGSTAGGYGEVHGGFGERNGGRTLLLDFAKVIEEEKSARGRSKIRWGALTKDKAQELEGRLLTMRALKSSEDASTMWSATINCVREAAREVLRVSTGVSGGHKEYWWWKEVV